MPKRTPGELETFRLPLYREIPDVGLYLEQCVKLVNTALSPLGEPELTASMVSNYVKKRLVAHPVRKQYYADHIASLFFIAIAKNVASLEDIRLLLTLWQGQDSVRESYEGFCEAFEERLRAPFGPVPDDTAQDARGELQTALLAAAVQRICLDRALAAFRQRADGSAEI